MTGEQLRDKKTRQQRPSNTTIEDKERRISGKTMPRKDKARDPDLKTTGENVHFYFLKMYLTPYI